VDATAVSMAVRAGRSRDAGRMKPVAMHRAASGK
jgi:hypothetical protein